MNKYYSNLLLMKENKQKKVSDFKQEKKQKLDDVVKDIANEINTIKMVIIFGSFIKEDSYFPRDVDIYIETLEAERYFEVRRRLEDELEIDVDLHTQDDSQSFIKRIKERGEVIYERGD